MKTNNPITLAASEETGATGIYHLKRFWSKVMAGQEVLNAYPDEAVLDSTLLDMLGIGLLPAYQILFQERPDFTRFEQWVVDLSNGHIEAETIERFNALFQNKMIELQSISDDVLTPEDIIFWEAHGYVILKNVVSPEDCTAARHAIMEYLNMDEKDPASWYPENDPMQGIMVPLYRNAAIDKNRNAPRIRRAFEQLWKRTDLVVTTDKCGFNPPETEKFKFRGTGLHWDVSLATPIPFGTQGILYLTDTASNQGALTVVPGFHKKLENWLKDLPEEVDPRQFDFSSFGPKPIAANAGDFIIWNHKLPHGSSPNRAQLPRIVQYINWYAALEKIQERWI